MRRRLPSTATPCSAGLRLRQLSLQLSPADAPFSCRQGVVQQRQMGTAPASATAASPCVCTVGDELLFGERESNGNERFMLRALHARGTPAALAAQLPDSPDTIAQFIRFAKEQGWSPIFVSGGLGGTHDDRTREAVALALGVPLTRHAECFDILSESFKRREIEFTPQRQRMADLPEGCNLIANPVGAPGFSIDGVYAFPGFPSMLHPMLTAVLEQLDSDPDSAAHSRGSLHTDEREFNCSEGVISDIVEDFAQRHPKLKLGIYPSNAEFGMRCKLVLRYSTGGEDDLAASTIDAVWEELLRECEAKAFAAKGRA